MLSTTDGDVKVKLVDFGMAKLYRDQAALQEALTISGNIVGTPLFMSPEQCLAKPLDARAERSPVATPARPETNLVFPGTTY